MHIKIKNYPSKDGKIGGNKKSDKTDEELEKAWEEALPPNWKPFWERNADKKRKDGGGDDYGL